MEGTFGVVELAQMRRVSVPKIPPPGGRGVKLRRHVMEGPMTHPPRMQLCNRPLNRVSVDLTTRVPRHAQVSSHDTLLRHRLRCLLR